MGWESFLSHVAELAELEEENVALTQMNWHFQGKTRSLPLGNIGGFTAMVTQIRALRVGGISDRHAWPSRPSCQAQSWWAQCSCSY
jgi:hypothetical protein